MNILKKVVANSLLLRHDRSLITRNHSNNRGTKTNQYPFLQFPMSYCRTNKDLSGWRLFTNLRQFGENNELFVVASFPPPIFCPHHFSSLLKSSFSSLLPPITLSYHQNRNKTKITKILTSLFRINFHLCSVHEWCFKDTQAKRS